MSDSGRVMAPSALRSAIDEGAFGLYPARQFRICNGASAGASTIAPARWYFAHETIAVPQANVPVAGFARRTPTFEDLRAWHAARASDAPIDYPPLVWVAAPQIIRHARLHSDGAALNIDDADLSIRLAAKIPLNRSYYDTSTTRFFDGRSLTARGHLDANGRFVVRMLWPEDFAIRDAPALRALPLERNPGFFLRELMREQPHGGALSPFAAFTLWRKESTRSDWRGRAVLAFVVNGAQGDDDEAHAGHFGVVTGRIAEDGDIGDWLVNNFYTLDAESEKGIIAAPVPLDNYLADLNSGQSYYRPSYLLVAVLAHDRAATLVQSAFGRVYNQFYRHQLVYYHPTTNCTSISVDTLRALGLDIRVRGPMNRLLAWTAFPLLAAKDRSIDKAMAGFDYLTVDQTRLMPAAAIEDIFDSLVSLCRGERRGESDKSLGRMLADDIESLAFLRIPQIPSSRAWGEAPVIDVREYRSRIPRDRSKMQVVPVPPRLFPDDLRDDDLLPPPPHLSRFAVVVWGAVLLIGIPIVVVALLAGCASPESSTKASLPPITPIMVPPAMKSSDDPTLTARAWSWQGSDLGSERVAPDAPERYTIEFQAEGRVQVRADCNRGGAAYTTRANRSLSIAPVATTKMGCPQGSRGAEFVRQLAETDGYDFVDGNLVLTLKSNAGVMRFAPGK